MLWPYHPWKDGSFTRPFTYAPFAGLVVLLVAIRKGGRAARVACAVGAVAGLVACWAIRPSGWRSTEWGADRSGVLAAAVLALACWNFEPPPVDSPEAPTS